LKPVVCRRVVGRLPSSRSKAWDGLSCEIARIRTRDFHLTTGTFNLVVKDRIAFRLSGALQSRRSAPKCESTVLETCTENLFKLLALLRTVNPSCAQDFHCLCTCGELLHFSALFRHATERIFRSNTAAFSAQSVFTHRRAEDHSLDKRSYGGSCEKRLNPSRSFVPE